MEKISWIDHATNEEVLERVEEERLVRDRRARRTGHVGLTHNESLQTDVLEGRIKGNGRVGDHTTRRTLD